MRLRDLLSGTLRYGNVDAVKYAIVEESLGREHSGRIRLRVVANDAMSFSSSLIWLLSGKLENCCLPELRHVLFIFSIFVLSRTNLFSNCLFMCKMSFLPTINSTLSGHVIYRPKLEEI